MFEIYRFEGVFFHVFFAVLEKNGIFVYQNKTFVVSFLLKFLLSLNWINIIYVIFWGGVSFVSSFIGILDGDWSKIMTGDLLQDIYNPLFIWIIAFFGDYLYTVFSLNKQTQILNERWTKTSYVLIEILFVFLLLSLHFNGSGRIICIVSLYMCMLGLKMSSLYALCPRQKVESV